MAENANTNLQVREGEHEVTDPANQAAVQDDQERAMPSAKHPRDESHSASGAASKRTRLNTPVPVHENMEIIRRAKQGATTTPATRTPHGPTPYPLWTPQDVCSLKISYGKHEKPNLDSQDTPLYDCFCELNLTSDKALDPPAYVHLSDREVGRLYLLVHMGHRTLEYLSETWPHVFDSRGALWEHREPQGEPSLGWRTYSGPRYPKPDDIKRNDRTEYVAAHGNYILMGSGTWYKMRNSSTQHYLIRCNETGAEGDAAWLVAAHKYIEDAQVRAKDHTKPHLLPWVQDADSYMYQVDDHRFAIKINPFRIQTSTFHLMDDLSLSIGMSRQAFDNDNPQTFEKVALLPNITLAPGERTREHWWVSYHTAHQRYVSMAMQGVHIARTSGTAPRYSRVETAKRQYYMSSVRIARLMNSSQRYWIAAKRLEAMADRRSNGSSEDSDSVRELEQRYRRALSDAPAHILEYPDRVAPGQVLVAGFSGSPFDELPELRARWYAEVRRRVPRGIMPSYCDKNEGDMHFIDVSAAIKRPPTAREYENRSRRG
jgi:hypothetical protein